MDEVVDTNEATLEIAGFWRRLLAFALDAILLGIVGAIAGLLAFDALASLGLWGRFLGFVVALSYFGILNSCLGGGRTLGKRVLGVRVVGTDGTLLSLPRSLLRYGILGIPFALNGAPLDVAGPYTPLTFLLSMVVFGGLLSTVYLYLFNTRTRQSLHDLAVGSWVVRTRPVPGVLPDQRTWRGHLVVVALIFAASVAMPALLGRVLPPRTMEDLMAIQQQVRQTPGVERVAVTLNRSFGKAEPPPKWLKLVIFVRDQALLADAEFAGRVATTVREEYPDAGELDRIVVVVSYGFDLGFASRWRSHTHSL